MLWIVNLSKFGTKSGDFAQRGWSHTAYIADNFKAVDFYKKISELGNNIFVETVVSMKTTTTKNVDDWLKTSAVKRNIDDLSSNLGSNKGIGWSGKTIIYEKAELHIYMPKENITETLRNDWLRKLKQYNPNIDYHIDTIENFIK